MSRAGRTARPPEQAADATGQEPVAEAQAEGDGNGHAAPEPGPAATDDGTHAEPADAPPPADVAGAGGAVPPPHINGRDAAPDPLEIPEFLRRVH